MCMCAAHCSRVGALQIHPAASPWVVPRPGPPSALTAPPLPPLGPPPESSCHFLLEACLGLGATRHLPISRDLADPGRKSMSCERTFRPTSSRAELEAMASELVTHLAADMVTGGAEGWGLGACLTHQSHPWM